MIIDALLLLIGLTGLVALVIRTATHPGFALPLVLGTELLNSRFQIRPVTISGVSIFAWDLIVVVLISAIVLRVSINTPRRRISLPLAALFVLASIGFLRGIRLFGLQVAGNNSREIMAFTAAALFFSTVVITPDLIRTFRRSLIAAAIYIFVVAVVFWVQNGFGEFSAAGLRPLNSRDAFVLQIALVVAVVFPYGRTRTRNLAVPFAGFLLLLLSLQRSAIISAAIALLIIVGLGNRGRTRRQSNVTRAVLIVGGILVALLALTGPASLTSDLGSAVESSTAQASTFNWRLEGWGILISRQLSGNIPSLLVGNPAGFGNLRIIGDAVVTVAPHSQYVSLLLTVGISGLFLSMWLLISIARRNVANLRSTRVFTAQVGLLFTALLTALAMFFITYSVGLVGGMLLGMFASMARDGAAESPLDQSDSGDGSDVAKSNMEPLVAYGDNVHSPLTVSTLADRPMGR